MAYQMKGDAFKYLEFEAGGSGPAGSGKWRVWVDQHGQLHAVDESNNDHVVLRKLAGDVNLENATISNAGAITGLSTLSGGAVRGTSIQAKQAEWWRVHDLNVFGAGVGGSPTLTAPAATTLGGYKLDAETEILYFSSRVGSDWDAASDAELKFLFTTNTAATASTQLKADCIAYFGGADTSAVVAQTLAVAMTLGAQSAGYTTAGTFTIDYDSSGKELAAGDTIQFKITLDTSGIGDVTVNHGWFRYQSLKVDEEI